MDNKIFDNIVCLFAHADDEFLFGFPAIKQAKKLICMTSDINNEHRAWCKRRKEAFSDICSLVDAQGVCLDYSSGFRGLEHKEMLRFTRNVFDLIAEAEVIFTHNAWGEYGHWDHIILHQLARASGKRVIVTDIALHADWYAIKPYSQGKYLGEADNDIVFHNKCMDIYRSYGAMGWKLPPVAKCGIYECARDGGRQ